MKLLKKLIITTSIAALGLTAVQAQERIAFGATNSQSAHYAYFAALAKVVNTQYPELQISVVETGATVDNLKRMARDQVDAGLITTSTLFQAYNGQGKFVDSMRLLASASVQVCADLQQKPLLKLCLKF
jgi:uncharacterized protein